MGSFAIEEIRRGFPGKKDAEAVGALRRSPELTQQRSIRVPQAGNSI